MAAKVQMIFEGDSKKVVDEMEKMRTKLRSVEGELARVKEQGKRTSKAVGGMGKTGGAALAGLKSGFMSLVAPVAGVTGAIALATKALADFNAERQRGAESAKGAFAGLQKLAQISGGKAGEFRSLVNVSAQMSLREGVPFTDSMDAVFSGRSLDLTKQEIASLSPFARVAEIEPVISGVGDVYAAFGRDEAGPALNVANKLGVTAARSKVSMADFSPKLSIIGASARMIGVGDEEAMAALAFMSAGQGQSPEIGANQIRAVMTAIRKSPDDLGIKGMGSFAEMIRGIMALKPEDRAKYFESDVRAAAGLSGLTMKLPQIEALTSELDWEQSFRAGTPTSYLQGTLRAFESAKIVRSLLANRRGAQERELSAMGAFGPGKLDFETLVDRALAALNARDETTVEKIQSRSYIGLYRLLDNIGFDMRDEIKDYMGDQERLRFTSRNEPVGVDITQPQAEKSLDLLNEALRENTEAVRGFWSLFSAPAEDKRTQIFYSSPNERAQMRTPSGRRDPSTGR
jgi:hypothetical protein